MKYAKVWDAICDTPEEAAQMRMKSELLSMLSDEIKAWGVTQAQAAQRLGVTQPRINDLLRGKISSITFDQLITLSTRAGLAISISVQRREPESA